MNTKKTTLCGVFSAAALLFLSYCQTTTESNDYVSKSLAITSRSTVVCFGDSLTYGHGADSKTQSFPACLQEKINIPVINAGKDDDTTKDGVGRFQKDVLDNEPAVLIIDFGGNDIFNSSKHQSYAQIEENFRTMLDQIDYEKTQVFIMRFYNDEMRFFDVFYNFDNILKRLQKDYDVVIIYDAWKDIWGHDDCKSSFTHCNAKGYAIMADNIFSVIEPCLEYNGLLR